LVYRIWGVVRYLGDAFRQATFYQVGEKFVCILEVWRLNVVSHFVVWTDLVIVEWWLVIHHKLEKNGDHVGINEIKCHLEVRLCKIFQQHEELIKVSPVCSGAMHHVRNE
jgi:hypothetical protein